MQLIPLLAMPMVARVFNVIRLESRPINILLIYAMGKNVAGVID
jgi:Na+-transporting methylmalonyl-CoA/oxaloacetate decarboxylase beta subunit